MQKNDVKLKKDQVLISRINSRLKAALAKAAKQNGETMSGYIERLVIGDLKDRGVSLSIEEKF